MTNWAERQKREHEMRVVAAVGPTSATWFEVEDRTPKRLSRHEFETALRRLENSGAVIRDENGNYTRDLQAWVEMRRNHE